MEESHKTTVFILTANDISPIHSAIRDRCITFHFKPIDDENTGRLEYIIDEEGLPQEWKEHLPHLIKSTGGSLRKSIDTLESLVREPDALSERIRRDGNYLSKAALNLMGSDYPKLTAYLVQALESGISGFGVIKGPGWRAKPSWRMRQTGTISCSHTASLPSCLHNGLTMTYRMLSTL